MAVSAFISATLSLWSMLSEAASIKVFLLRGLGLIDASRTEANSTKRFVSHSLDCSKREAWAGLRNLQTAALKAMMGGIEGSSITIKRVRSSEKEEVEEGRL